MQVDQFLQNDKQTIDPNREYWFPGRWVGGIASIAGPLFLLTGVLLRIPFHFFFPQQLQAYKDHPQLVFAAYSFFLAGNILLFPAIITLARLIAIRKPVWAICGGLFVVLGLFARTFHAGVDHLAFQLVAQQGVVSATDIVAKSYGAYHIVSALSPLIMLGWVSLAAGAYLSGTMGLLRSIAMAMMSSLMIGVLKGSSWVSVIATAGLCIALVPLGIQVLYDGPRPGYKAVIGWTVFVLLVMAGLIVVGQLG